MAFIPRGQKKFELQQVKPQFRRGLYSLWDCWEIEPPDNESQLRQRIKRGPGNLVSVSTNNTPKQRIGSFGGKPAPYLHTNNYTYESVPHDSAADVSGGWHTWACWHYWNYSSDAIVLNYGDGPSSNAGYALQVDVSGANCLLKFTAFGAADNNGPSYTQADIVNQWLFMAVAFNFDTLDGYFYMKPENGEFKSTYDSNVGAPSNSTYNQWASGKSNTQLGNATSSLWIGVWLEKLSEAQIRVLAQSPYALYQQNRPLMLPSEAVGVATPAGSIFSSQVFG